MTIVPLSSYANPLELQMRDLFLLVTGAPVSGLDRTVSYSSSGVLGNYTGRSVVEQTKCSCLGARSSGSELELRSFCCICQFAASFEGDIP